MIQRYYTDEFQKDVAKIKDNLIRSRIKKLVQRLIDNPISGKPLKYDYAGFRSLRIPPFPIIYEFNEKEKTIILHKFEHRERAYK